MTMMQKFNDIINKLNEEHSLPNVVNNKMKEAFEQLEEKPCRSRKIRKGYIAAAMLALMFCGFCYANPALASNLPIIGSIIQLIENKTEYPGSYDQMKPITKNEESLLSTDDNGIKITASEVYSDGFSIYVTMQMESAKYNFDRICKNKKNDGQYICTDTSYGINEKPGQEYYDITLQGESRGKNVFVGMMKFDKTDYSLEDGMVNISIKGIHLENDDFERGEWNLSIPYFTITDSAAQDGVKEITVDSPINDSITVDKIFVSKYQLVIFTTQSCGQLHKDYIFREIAVFDQAGNQLSPTQAMNQTDGNQYHMFSIGDKEVSKINIYYTADEKNRCQLAQAVNEAMANKLSDGCISVDIK